MDTLFDSPFTPALLAGSLVGLVLSMLARLWQSPVSANLVPPAVFLAAYYETYAKIPDFPPVGSTNKVFYAALGGAVVGLVLDLLAERRAIQGVVGRAAIVVVAVLIALWIALPRLASADTGLLVLLACVMLGGAVLLLLVAALAAADPPAGGAMVGWAVFAALPGVFAPIALFGGSSTSVGLCLGLAAGLAMCALVSLFAPRALGLAAILGAGGGLLAVIDTVALITRRVDLLALAVFLVAPIAGRVGAGLLPRRAWAGPRLRAIIAGLFAAAPVAAILVLLFLRHESPL
jgi:hypothetical protein